MSNFNFAQYDSEGNLSDSGELSCKGQALPSSGYFYGDGRATYTPGGSGTYTVQEVTHPIFGKGIKLTTGLTGTDACWLDIISASGLGYVFNKDVLNILVSDGVNTSSAQFIVSYRDTTDPSSGTSNYTDSLVPYSGARVLPIRLDGDTFAGSLDLAIVDGLLLKSLRIKILNNGSTAGASLCVYGVIRRRMSKTPIMLMDFDDAFLSQYTEAFQYMMHKGIIGNVNVIASTVGKTAGQVDAFDYCTLPQLQAMNEAGWGMCTHGYYPHRTNLVSKANIETDMKANRDYVKANFYGTGYEHYVLPAGEQSVYTLGALQSLGFLTARTTEKQLICAAPSPAPYFIPSVQFSAFVGLTNLKKFYDRAKETGLGVRFQAHRIVSSVSDTQNEISITDFQAFIDYIVTDIQYGKVWNPSVPDWYKEQSKILWP